MMVAAVLEDWDGVVCDQCRATFPTVRELREQSRKHGSQATEEDVMAIEILKMFCLSSCMKTLECGPQYEDHDRMTAVLLVQMLN